MKKHQDETGAAQEDTMDVSKSRRRLLQGMSVATLPGLAGLGAGMVSAPAAQAQVRAPARITTTPFKIAICSKAASPTFQIEEGINTLIGYMQQAKANGARMLSCGELWLPGYPYQLNYDNAWRSKAWANYVANSMTIGDSNWMRILNAARTIGIQVTFGFSELAGNYAYMSQAMIGEDGNLIYSRRKVRPSGSERNYWSDDVMAPNIQVPTTPLGRISMLMCWDHLRPQSTFDVMAQLPNIHVCAWPYIYSAANSAGWERAEVAHSAAAYFSQVSGAITIVPCVGHVAVFQGAIKLGEILPDDPTPLLYHTVTPRNWTGRTGTTNGEMSYGVLQLLAQNYPGDKVPDPERSVLRLNPLS